jgi:DedD protein
MAMTFYKQRLLGAIIIIALAVIFLPMLWQESKGPVMAVSSIPERPSMMAQQTYQTLAPITQLPAAHKLFAWSLQIGVFDKQVNSQKLLDQLQKNKFPAYQKISQGEAGQIYNVFVGPLLNQSRLQSLADKLKSQLHLQGSMVKFYVMEK